MATATATQTPQTPPALDATFAQMRELNEHLVDAARTASVQYLDAYEKAVDHAVGLERKLADEAKQDWVKDLINAHAKVTAELTGAYASAARDFLK